LLLAQAVSSCAPRALDWSVDASEGSLQFAVRTFVTSIHEGGCEGPVVYEATFDRDEVAPEPPRLGSGTYGFAAEGRTETCVSIARGCTEVTLPGPDEVVTTLSFSTDGEPGCDPSQCIDGVCTDDVPPDDCDGCPLGTICIFDGRCAEPCGDGACLGFRVECCEGIDLCCSDGCPPAGNPRACDPPITP
jgi:hypothetical protein